MKERRLEIFGILLVVASLLILFSLLGYDENEDPKIFFSANQNNPLEIKNPMGLFGMIIAHYFIKAGFGIMSIIVPLLGIVWGFWFFTHKEFEPLTRLSFYLIGVMVLGSITLGLYDSWELSQGSLSLKKIIQDEDIVWKYGGFIGGVIATMFLGVLQKIGSVILLLTSWLVLIRGYFRFSYYHPIRDLLTKLKKKYEEKKLVTQQKSVEDEKRLHTQSLISKIDAQRSEESKNVDFSNKKIDRDEFDGNDEIVESEEISDETDPLEDIAKEGAQSEKDDDISIDQDAHEESIDTIDGINFENKDLSNDVIKVDEVVKEEEVKYDDVKEKTPKKAYQLPLVDILEDPKVIPQSGMSSPELVDRANFLQQSLETFGVVGKVVKVSPGPVITLFEVEPADGVRVNKFVALSDDLARVMEASRVRVIAPIPGKSSVGIEIPNPNPDMVYFKSVINSEKFASSDSKLTLAIGKNTTGEIATLDLAQMPHLLIAGTTGSGKSVCMNTILASMLYQATPDEVKFVIIDPKKVEMAVYRSLKDHHLLKIEDIDEPIVTKPENAVLALRAVEKEMGRRYDVLADAVVRNISEYNKKMVDKGEDIMPFIVVLIDELADLMMLNAKEVEAPIARLAQLARAVGIHLVVATQRPSVDVITGVIKANFPSRIAFQVATKIDSRTIIDSPGAEKLIGRGDLLYLGYGSSEPIRLHNAYLDLKEIEGLMSHVTNQSQADELVLASPKETLGAGGLVETNDNNGSDDLFDEAVRLVVMHQQGSISLIQRRLKVGYSRAARLIDEMEQSGIVGPFTGSKAREVLVDESYLDSLN